MPASKPAGCLPMRGHRALLYCGMIRFRQLYLKYSGKIPDRSMFHPALLPAADHQERCLGGHSFCIPSRMCDGYCAELCTRCVAFAPRSLTAHQASTASRAWNPPPAPGDRLTPAYGRWPGSLRGKQSRSDSVSEWSLRRRNSPAARPPPCRSRPPRPG